MTELSAPAKLTWFLEVTGVREDGQHLLRSEMVSLNLADTVAIEPAQRTTVSWRSVHGVRLDRPMGGDDLVERALLLARRTAQVTVTKRIPLGGGLGGGSSDAAAVLRWAQTTDLEAAAGLGGDVPYCVVGGRATVEGIGEKVTPLAFEARTVTLIVAPFGIDTAACYRAYDTLVASGQRPGGRNHLRAAACVVEPQLGVAMSWCAAELGRTVELCGSGSTMFVEGSLDEHRDEWVLSSPVGVLRFLRATTVAAT